MLCSCPWIACRQLVGLPPLSASLPLVVLWRPGALDGRALIPPEAWN